MFLRRDTSVGPNRGLVPLLVTGLSSWIDMGLTLDLPPIGMICVNPLPIVVSLDLIIVCGYALSVW